MEELGLERDGRDIEYGHCILDCTAKEANFLHRRSKQGVSLQAY